MCYAAGMIEQERFDGDEHPQPLFELGQLVGTPGALRALEEAGQHPAEFILRHVTGDWSELPEEDIAENERSVAQGLRYSLPTGCRPAPRSG